MHLNHESVGAGPTVVLLHGFPFDQTMWDSQKAALGDSYRVIAPDLRGHGRTPASSDPATIDAMADDVVELLEAESIAGPVVVGGLSMGGYIALSIAARYPTRLRALILMDTRADADTPEAARSREGSAREVERTGDVGPVVRGMIPRVFSPVSLQKRPDLVARRQEQMLRTSAPGVAATLRALGSRPDRTAMLASIHVPTLVVCGVEDAISPPDVMRRMAEAIPNASFLTIPEAGHLAPLENPGPVNQALLDFLRGLELSA